jgi:hypothetical protein
MARGVSRHPTGCMPQLGFLDADVHARLLYSYHMVAPLLYR